MYYPESGDRPWTIQNISFGDSGQSFPVHPMRMIREKVTSGDLSGQGSALIRINLSVYFLLIFCIHSLFGNL